MSYAWSRYDEWHKKASAALESFADRDAILDAIRPILKEAQAVVTHMSNLGDDISEKLRTEQANRVTAEAAVVTFVTAMLREEREARYR